MDIEFRREREKKRTSADRFFFFGNEGKSRFDQFCFFVLFPLRFKVILERKKEGRKKKRSLSVGGWGHSFAVK